MKRETFSTSSRYGAGSKLLPPGQSSCVQPSGFGWGFFQIHDKNTPWKSFLVIVEGASKNDEGHKTELPDEEYDVSPKIPEKLLSFSENGHYQNLTAVPGSVTALHDNGSATGTDCKSDGTPGPQEALIATTLSELTVLHTQTDSIQPQLHALVNME